MQVGLAIAAEVTGAPPRFGDGTGGRKWMKWSTADGGTIW